MSPRLPPAPELEWVDASSPRSSGFEDLYFSQRGGLAETECVFIDGCHLPEGWRGRDRFAIAELGFGTGLNVLAVWKAWLSTKKTHAILHVSTVEAYLCDRADAARALRAFPEVAPLSDKLLARWPVRARAPQRLWFPEDGFCLDVHIGEAAEVLPQWSGRFDAWFLDGFAPSRNPAMWSDPVLDEVRRLSAPGARVASFTVAGAVRRGLQARGFVVEKKPGFGAKRERLEARAPEDTWESEAEVRGDPGLTYPCRAVHPRRVGIVGGGIAGAAAADALKRRGVTATVFDAEGGNRASGNPVGLVAPRLDRGEGPLREVYLAAYLHAIDVYRSLGDAVLGACGVEQIADPRKPDVLGDLIADPPLPPDWFQPRDLDAVLHAPAGIVRPEAAIAAWLNGVEVRRVPVSALKRLEQGWRLIGENGDGLCDVDAVVLAAGIALPKFPQCAALPIALSRGQIEWGALNAMGLDRARMRGTYVAPFEKGVLFGATFDAVDGDAVDEAAQAEADVRSRVWNLKALADLAPEVAAALDENSLQSRAALRASTPDRAPMAGLLPDEEGWREDAKRITAGWPVADAPVHDGLYVLGGLGARGLTLAPLLAERLASEMFDEPQLLSARAIDAVHPARFLHRAMRRGA